MPDSGGAASSSSRRQINDVSAASCDVERSHSTNGKPDAIAMVDDDEGVGDMDGSELWQEFGWDDNSGASLPVELVKAARQEEMDYLRTRGTYKIVKKKECRECTGRSPISTRWVDCD